MIDNILRVKYLTTIADLMEPNDYDRFVQLHEDAINHEIIKDSNKDLEIVKIYEKYRKVDESN